MEINRKRVAKRLASGLVAGALALGGLALTGASPAGATNPDWDYNSSTGENYRIGGADRYETSVLVSIDLFDGGNPVSLIIASGENPADALAASSLAGQEDASILLVQRDALPTSVADYLTGLGDDDFEGDVWVIGGEAAISEDVYSAIEDLLPDASLERVAGDNRYETAAEINALLDAFPSHAIIVNGADGRWPDALSVGQIAALMGWPIIVTGDGGLNDAATEQIDSLLLDDDETQFVLVGGTAVLPQSVEDYLLDEGVAQGSIRRLGGADRYGTNVLINAYILEAAADGDYTTGENVFDSGLWTFDLPMVGGGDAGYGVTLVSGESPWDALSATPWTTSGTPYHLILVKRDSLPPLTGVAAGLLSQIGGAQGVNIIGGRSAVSEAVRTQLFAALNTDAPAPTASGCAEGSTSITLDYTGLDGLTTAYIDSGLIDLDIVGFGVEVWLNPEDLDGTDVLDTYASRDDLPGAEEGGLAAVAAPSALALYETGHHLSVSIYEAVGDGQENESFDWAVVTLAEDDEVVVRLPNDPAYQEVDDYECTIVEDDVAPTVSITASTDGIFVTASEPVVWNEDADTAGDVTDAAEAHIDFADPETTDVSNPFVGPSTKWFIPFDATQDENLRVYLTAGFFADLAGNVTETTVSARTVEDDSDPSISKVASFCVNTNSPSWEIALDTSTLILIKNNMVAEAGGSTSGPAGNSWTVEIVDDRGGDMATVAVDNEDETLTITADIGRATGADIYRAFVDAGLTGLLGSWTLDIDGGDWTDVLDADEDEVELTTEGDMDCTVLLSHSEPSQVTWADSDLDGTDLLVVDFGLGDTALNTVVYGTMSLLKFEDVTEVGAEIEINLGTAPIDPSDNADGETRLTFTI